MCDNSTTQHASDSTQSHYRPQHIATSTPDTPHNIHSWPTFAAWCQQHAAITRKILVNRRLADVFSIRINTDRPTTTNTSTSPTNRNRKNPNPYESSDENDRERAHIRVPAVPVPPNTPFMYRLRPNSTIRRHHVRFRTMMLAVDLTQRRCPTIFTRATTHTTIPHEHTLSLRPYRQPTKLPHTACSPQNPQYHTKDLL